MKAIRKFVLPVVAGFVLAGAFTWTSLMLFAYRFAILPGKMRDLLDSDSVSLTVMMTLSAFLLYAGMLLCRRINGRLLDDAQEEKSGRFTAMFILGAAIAAGCFMLLAFANEGTFAATLVMICYMIICDLVVILSFSLLMLLVRGIFKWLRKNGDFLYKLRWLLPLSLFWFTAIFVYFLLM